MGKIYNRILAKILLAAVFVVIPASLICQTTSDGSMPQYYFQNFTTGKVIMKNGQIQTPQMNYNTVTERMVFMRDDKYYDLTNPEMVDTIIIQDIKFVPVGKIFYEVLLSGPSTLFVQQKGSLLPAGQEVGYGGKSQLASAHYISNVELSSGRYNLPLPSDYLIKISPVYWIHKDGEMFSFINEKQFLNLYPDKADKIKDFIKANRIKIDRNEHLIKLVSFCNNLN